VKQLFQLFLEGLGKLDGFKQLRPRAFRFTPSMAPRPLPPPKEVKNQQANEQNGYADGHPQQDGFIPWHRSGTHISVYHTYRC
jgi:hypothetical protein